MPTNEGNLVKSFELELTNMEGSPSYSLTHQLTIGSEIGNIIIADPSVSPRHATFILQQDVISVIDHGSVAGTTVNGKTIPSGRYIILEETDTVTVGDLEIKFRTGSRVVSALEEEDIPLAPVEEVKEVSDETAVHELIPLDADEGPALPPEEVPEEEEAVPEPKKKLEPLVSGTSTYSANALVRVIAVILDLILSYSLLVIFLPFDEFKNFLSFIPDETAALLGVEWGSLWDSLAQDHAAVGEIAKDIWAFVTGYLPVGQLALVFLLVRLASTLVLGVSISERLLSIVPVGNKIWARIGGPLRVLIGAVTGPFLIFDVPAIVSRRTLKEFLTFTNIQVRSKFIATLGAILLLPLFMAMALLSPLLQGLEPPESIVISDSIEKRVKVQRPVEDVAPPVSVTDASKFFHLELSYNPEQVLLVPLVKFQGVKKKVSYQTELAFYHRDLQRTATFELMKTFDLQQLLAIGIKGNFLLYEKYPELHAFVYQAEGAFKPDLTERAQSKFANEFMSFTKLSFNLGVQNALETMEMETPFLRGLLDYRQSLLSLLEYKDFEQVRFMKIGNTVFLKVTYGAQKPFDLIIPLVKGEGRIYKVEFDKKENLAALSSKFYKYTLDKANWLSDKGTQTGETLSPFQVTDLLGTLDVARRKLSPEKAQALYGYYFERSAEVLKRDDAIEYELWKKSVASIVKVIDNLQESKTESEEDVDPVKKLKQNFRDLSEAFEGRNLMYFGLNETQTI